MKLHTARNKKFFEFAMARPCGLRFGFTVDESPTLDPVTNSDTFGHGPREPIFPRAIGLALETLVFQNLSKFVAGDWHCITPMFNPYIISQIGRAVKC